MFTLEGDRPREESAPTRPGGEGHVTLYAETDDLQASLDKAESLGGRRG
jgi:hypothetical protein